MSSWSSILIKAERIVPAFSLCSRKNHFVYHPTSRVLTVLELLQARPLISGPALAERLEVDVRTVRHYIMTLQDIGIPVETV